MTIDADALGAEPYCYLTTTGRKSGEPRTIEIWFALVGETAYLMAGGGERAHWVQNLRADPRVQVRIGASRFPGTAMVVSPGPDDELARQLLFEKYQPGYASDLAEWRVNSLLVAIDLDFAAATPA